MCDQVQNVEMAFQIAVSPASLILHKKGGRTGLVVRASDSGSGDLGSILGRVGVLFP